MLADPAFMYRLKSCYNRLLCMVGV
jgi:hypothetical protein